MSVVERFLVRENWPGYPIGVMLAFGGARKDMVVDSLERRGCSRDTCLSDWKWDARPNSSAHTAVFPCHRVMIWFAQSNPTPRTIAHECFHAAYGSLPHLGIPLTDDTEEAYAYAMDNLIGLVERVLSEREKIAA